MSAALRLVAILATGYLVGFWVIRVGGSPLEAMVLSLIITSLMGFIGRILEQEEE